MDVIYQGEMWQRTVTILDTQDPPEPIDPTELVATLYPDTPLTITGPDDPGVYVVTLTADETAALAAQRLTTWDLFGVIGSARRLLVRADVVVQPTSSGVSGV